MDLSRMVPDAKMSRAGPPRHEARHAAWSKGEACSYALTHEHSTTNWLGLRR